MEERPTIQVRVARLKIPELNLDIPEHRKIAELLEKVKRGEEVFQNVAGDILYLLEPNYEHQDQYLVFEED